MNQNIHPSKNNMREKMIPEIAMIIQENFKVTKYKLKFLSIMIRQIQKEKTVNIAKLSVDFSKTATENSSTRQIERFYNEFEFKPGEIINFAMKRFPQQKYVLILDRTDWKFGKTPINILMLSILVNGYAIPLNWVLLDKKGISNQQERIDLLLETFNHFPKEKISDFLADREFIGSKWISFFKENNIPYTIRIKQNTHISIVTSDFSEPLIKIVDCIKKGQRVYLQNVVIWGVVTNLCIKRDIFDGSFLFLITSFDPKEAAIRYKNRWKIEIMFSNFKSRGFNLEDTHMTDLKKLSLLIAVITITYSLIIQVAVFLQANSNPVYKKHGFLAKSWVNQAFSYIKRAISFNFAISHLFIIEVPCF
jgi:hypothetical protein